MKTIYFNDNVTDMTPCVATIGFFDGVHKGHSYLIEQLTAVAAERGMASAIITFDRHPQQVIGSGSQIGMLSTLDEKIIELSKTGVDCCVIIPFTKELASLPAFDFMSRILRTLKVDVLLTGYDNRFGHNRAEGFDDYVRHGSRLGIEVLPARPLVQDGRPVSSSLIRKMLAGGLTEEAAEYLGRPYTFTGKVVEGFHIGRSIHFPTANLQMTDGAKLVPKPGVYAVRVRMKNSMEFKRGMMNIGMRPTFNGSKTTIEVNIFNCCERLYGEVLTVAVGRRLRDEKKFAGKGELMEQLQKDAEAAMEDKRPAE